jgi:DNA-binding CsgD family transcriptional regulator
MNDTNLMIPTEDAVSIARLLGEVAGHDGDVAARKRLLMQRLQDLTDADGWLWSLTRCDYSKDQPMSLGVIHDGLTDSQFAGWVEASQVAAIPPPEDKALADEFLNGRHFTRTRQQLVPDEQWYGSPTIQKYRLDRGIDDFVYSIFPLGPETASAIGLFRHVGRERFSPRDRRIVHIVLSNVPWLHTVGLPHKDFIGISVQALTPTRRMVLVHLLDGKRRPDIAKLLNITENTARDHIRAVLRHFRVKDQLDLVCWFRAGNGGDVA